MLELLKGNTYIYFAGSLKGAIELFLDLLKGDIYIHILLDHPERRPLLTGYINAGLLKGDMTIAGLLKGDIYAKETHWWSPHRKHKCWSSC